MQRECRQRSNQINIKSRRQGCGENKMAFRKRIVTDFKLQGLQLTNEATTFLVEVLDLYKDSEDITRIIDDIIEAVQKQPLKKSLLDKDVIETAVEECNQETDSDPDKALVLINAFETPPFTYNPDQKKFLPVPLSSMKLFASAAQKTKLSRERYNLIYQRTIRHHLFSPPVVGVAGSSKDPKFRLHTIEYLLSSSGLPDKIIVLGMLIQLRERKFYLEDLTGKIELDLSACLFHSGLFVENSIVLAEGLFKDGVFHLSAIGCPPIESSAITRNYFGNINFFGGPSPIAAKASVKLQDMLQGNPGAMLVFFSDLFLDDDKVLEKLPLLFSGYSIFPPAAFIFMGNFSSAPYGADRHKRLKDSFKALGDIMLNYPDLLEKSQFFFVPGPLDPGPGDILPRPPIPSYLTSDITSRISNVTFCSNPCRIQFCTREIVVFREDILTKMSRHCVRFPTEGTDMANHFTKTILSQGHLCPLPLHSRPIYWMYDHALRLYPLPDLVMIGDKCNPFSVTSGDCMVVNTGSFPKNGFEFRVYIPHSNTIEDSQLV